MGTELRRLPFARVSPSDANFHLVELGEHAWDRLAPALEREGMVVRRRPDMPGHMRVTSMRPAANRALLDVLARVAR